VLLVLAACYAPAAPAGAPCSPTGACPADQTCVVGVCTTSSGSLPDANVTIDGPPGDRDADGVADAVDNCPDVANADQADEDKDGVGDVCDLCPQLAGATVDADGDKIGDACDPNPTLADSTWLFEGFHKGQPSWPASAHWVAVPDALRVSALGGTNDPEDYVTLPLTLAGRTYDNFSVTAIVSVDQLVGNSGDHYFGINAYDATMTKGVSCEFEQFNGTNTLDLLEVLSNGSLGSLKKMPAFAWTTATSYRLNLTRHGSTYTCTINGPATSQTATGTSQVVPRAGDAVQLYAFGVTAQLASVFVAGPR
jgi:hypothetical protein